MLWRFSKPVLAHQSILITLCFLSLFTPHCVIGQTVINGQTFTNGLAILDAPAMSSTLHAGSIMSLAVEVSGNGKLDTESYLPKSKESTRFDLLEIYLVSAKEQLNLTVSGNTTLLDNERGSTVKHLDWPIPRCVPSGGYNLTIYEGSHINNSPYFSITSVPIRVDNTDKTGSCPSNPFKGGVQVSSPPVPNPLQGSGSPGTTPLPGGVSSNLNPTVITIVISGSGPLPFDFPTVTVTDTLPPVTRTVVLESAVTLTTVVPGPTDSVTVTITTIGQTTTTVVSQGDGRFLPIGAANPLAVSSLLSIATLVIMSCYLVLS
jgi:hypothetical protein